MPYVIIFLLLLFIIATVIVMNVPGLKRSLTDISAPINFYNNYIGNNYVGRGENSPVDDDSNAPYEKTDELVSYIWSNMVANPSFGPYDGSLDEGAKKINSRFTNRHVSGVRTMVLPFLRSKQIRDSMSKTQEIINALGSAPSTDQILIVASNYKLPPQYVLHIAGLKNDEVEAVDLTSPLVGQRTRLIADQYERDVENYLKQVGAEFKTERDLINEGSQLTPDFLLTKPIELSKLDPRAADSKTLIHWIDAKNYPMFNLKLTQQKLIKQAAKYTSAFGYGAFIFSKGVSARAENVGAALINGESMAKLALHEELTIN